MLAFGVNQYANAQYNLKYAVADATVIRRRSTSATDETAAVTSASKSSPLLDKDATKANILLALKRLANAQAALPADAPTSSVEDSSGAARRRRVDFLRGSRHGAGLAVLSDPARPRLRGSARRARRQKAVKTILAHSVSDRELEAAFEGIRCRAVAARDRCLQLRAGARSRRETARADELERVWRSWLTKKACIS